jgi:hypothetical protein
MELHTLIELAREYADLGDSMMSQLDALVDTNDVQALVDKGELNPNALPWIQRFLEKAAAAEVYGADGLLDLIDDYERGL